MPFIMESDTTFKIVTYYCTILYLTVQSLYFRAGLMPVTCSEQWMKFLLGILDTHLCSISVIYKIHFSFFGYGIKWMPLYLC
jgi:hypothetical protein